MIDGIADDKSLMILNEPSTQAEVCFQQTTFLFHWHIVLPDARLSC